MRIFNIFVDDINAYHGSQTKKKTKTQDGFFTDDLSYKINSYLQNELLANFYTILWNKSIDEFNMSFSGNYAIKTEINIIDFNVTLYIYDKDVIEFICDDYSGDIHFDDNMNDYVIDNNFVFNPNKNQILEVINAFKYSIRLNQLLLLQFKK